MSSSLSFLSPPCMWKEVCNVTTGERWMTDTCPVWETGHIYHIRRVQMLFPYVMYRHPYAHWVSENPCEPVHVWHINEHAWWNDL